MDRNMIDQTVHKSSIDVDTDLLRKVASSLDNIADEITSTRVKMTRVNNDVAVSWKSESSSLFLERADFTSEQIGKTSSSIHQSAVQLRNIVVKIEALEKELSSKMEKI